MKRVRAGCILQTLCFLQKPDCGLSQQAILRQNREELKRYKQNLDRTNIRYRIDREEELADGSILIHVRKQYNDNVSVDEYFQ